MSATVPTPATTEVDAIVTKVQKHLDQLKAKNQKLAEDNAKLKQQLSEARSAHSRIRRIPKTKPAEASA